MVDHHDKPRLVKELQHWLGSARRRSAASTVGSTVGPCPGCGCSSRGSQMCSACIEYLIDLVESDISSNTELGGS